MIALFSGSPGTIGTVPDLVGFSASSRISSRMPAIRAALSGPWQRKQVSDMMGRMSRLNFTGPPVAAAQSVEHAAIQRSAAVRLGSIRVEPSYRLRGAIRPPAHGGVERHFSGR